MYNELAQNVMCKDYKIQNYINVLGFKKHALLSYSKKLTEQVLSNSTKLGLSTTIYTIVDKYMDNFINLLQSGINI